MSGEKEHLTAVVTLMQTAGAVPKTLSDLTGGTLPTKYNEVHVMQRLGDGPRRSGLPSELTQWRILIRSVAQGYGDAQTARQKASDALHEAKLTVDGVVYFVERSISDDPIAPDDGWWSGTSEFTY